MQGQTPSNETAPSTPFKPPSGAARKGFDLGTALAAVAVVLAVVAVAVAFVVPGPAGSNSQSPTTPPGVTYWAVVNATGGLVRGLGVNNTTQASTGTYNVTFDNYLWGCSFQGSVGTTSTGNPPPGYTQITTLSNKHAIQVQVYSGTNARVDQSFHVVAFCPGGLSAQVESNGTPIGGSGLNYSFQWGVGIYVVIFNVDVTNCAYVGGLGTGTASSGSHGTATFASRYNDPYGVWVQTYDSTGTSTNESFHLSVYC